jgi:hypothetical protein
MRHHRRKRRKGRSKGDCQTVHAKRRGLERYQIEATENDLRHIVNLIQKNKATFVSRQSLRVSIWDVGVDFGTGDKTVRVVYDRDRKTIVTFLPMDDERGDHALPDDQISKRIGCDCLQPGTQASQ